MQTFLVTGAMGFIGSHWCEHLLKQGKTVLGLDLGCFYPKLIEYPNFKFAQDTIKNYELLSTMVGEADCICHFAGIACPDQYTQYPRKVIDVTAVAGLRLIELCRMKNKLFFLTSTSEIYGKNNKVPFSEEDDRVLGATSTKRWCYSTSKALLEHQLDACALYKEITYITVRLFNVYGPRLHGRVVSNFLERALNDEPLLVHGDGSQTRSFTYIDDVIQAFELLINTKKAHNNIFNIGNPAETSINELAQCIVESCDTKSAIEHINHEAYYGSSYEDIDRRVPDITKVSTFTGWKPSTSLSDGLKATFTTMRDETSKC